METKVIVATPPPHINEDFKFKCNENRHLKVINDNPIEDFEFDNKFRLYVNDENSNTHFYEDDFEFNYSGQLQRPSLSADELFHAGKILPLNLMEESARIQNPRSSSFSIPSTKITARSDDVFPRNKTIKPTSSSSFSSFFSTISLSKCCRKWRFRNFPLFRSFSEGRDSLRKKYAVLCKTTAYDDVNNSSFRSIENSGSVSKRRGPVSAHELHYTVNRAASEELKRKTMLPYKQGLLGCLDFNHDMTMHQISRRFGSLERS